MGLPLRQTAIALGKRSRKGVGLIGNEGIKDKDLIAGEWQAARHKARLWIT